MKKLNENSSQPGKRSASLLIIAAVLTAVVAGLGTHTAVWAEESREETSGSALRVGIFDSRAVAMAYYRSAAFGRHMEGLKAEYEEAKAARNKKRVKEMEAQSARPTWPDSSWPPSQAQQELIHKQGFSTWPVDNVLEKIKGHLPEVARQADVSIIVSVWDLAYQSPAVEFVDVTFLMVKPFEPDEATLELVRQLKTQRPVPLEELRNHQG